MIFFGVPKQTNFHRFAGKANTGFYEVFCFSTAKNVKKSLPKGIGKKN
jgi:hypothetical protein